MTEIYDVAIIGAGTAGLSALREVRKYTDNFVLVNAGHYGTTCARVGCMPSKVLIESANQFYHRRDLDSFGIHGADRLRIDIPAVLKRVRSLRDDFVAGILQITADLGERSIAGRARLVAPDELQIGNNRLRARRIIIATGSRPIMPAQWSTLRQRVFTTDELFEQADLPARMAVIGLGAIGVEFSQALARLGIVIDAYGAGPTVCGLNDPLVNAQVLQLLRAECAVSLNARATLHAHADGIRVSDGDKTVVVDAVLAALGRQPNIEGLGLECLGVALDAQGMPPFNSRTMQIADLPVYIAGDVTNDLPVLHVANDEGHIAGYNAFQQTTTCFRARVPLAIVFSDPNVAVVGTRLADLDTEQIVIGAVSFLNQGRARIAAENRGLLRVYARQQDGLLLGAEMCAPRGEHLAQLLALAIEQHATVHSLLRMPFYHPVFEEGLRTALRDAARQLQVSVDSDLASCEPLGAVALD